MAVVVVTSLRNNTGCIASLPQGEIRVRLEELTKQIADGGGQELVRYLLVHISRSNFS